MYDDLVQRDLVALSLSAARDQLAAARRSVSGQFGWAPLTEAQSVVELIDDALDSIAAAGELVHGSLDEQAQRWLSQPTRFSFHDAVMAAGVGGVVTKHTGQPTAMAVHSREFRVINIDECSARLRCVSTLAEFTVRFDVPERMPRWSLSERSYQS